MDDLPPPLPRPLDYRPPQPRRVPVAVQGLLGFVAWFGAVAAFAGGVYLIAPRDGSKVIAPALFATIGVLLAAGLVQLRLGWRGFVPGVMLGLLLTCLVPVGIVAVACRGGLGLGH